MKDGFAPILLVVLLVVTAAFAGGGVYLLNRESEKLSPTPVVTVQPILTPNPIVETTPIPTPTPTPSPKSSPKASLKPKSSSTPKPTVSISQNPCDKFVPANGLATITINLQPASGQSIVGDTLIKIKPGSSCPGSLSPGWNGELVEIMRQGTTSWTSPGFGPGKFRVDVQYHYSGQGFDVDAVSGGNSLSVTLNN